MRHTPTALFALLLSAAWQPAQAESLRCSGGLVAAGDSRPSVSHKCGPPLLQDSFCEPVYQAPFVHPLPEHLARRIAPCLRIDEWLYERGEGHLMATVRFRNGVVQSIAYGREPR